MPANALPLEGRTCLVTGASRGLGSRIAAAFWEAGASLFLVARSAAALESVSAALTARAGQRFATFPADLADPEAPGAIVGAARRTFPAMDILVNNAAVPGPIGRSWENDPGEWSVALRVNLLAPVELCRLCVPLLGRNRRGKILNISGGGATAARPNFSAYATAKAGLVRYTETLAEELREREVDANCVAPGPMATALVDAVTEAGPLAAGAREYEIARALRDRGDATPERAAALCVFLASAASDGITGKLISAVWDPWERLPAHLAELRDTDIYTLRRIVPRDRGRDWGERG